MLIGCEAFITMSFCLHDVITICMYWHSPSFCHKCFIYMKSIYIILMNVMTNYHGDRRKLTDGVKANTRYMYNM